VEVAKREVSGILFDFGFMVTDCISEGRCRYLSETMPHSFGCTG
jgi:hypothetical protein